MLRIGVLGAGRIGKVHAANVAVSRRATLISVADPVIAAAEQLADQFSCEACQDPVAVIERTDIDAVVIATPTDTHVSLTLRAIAQGKAVLCEKPIDLDIAKVDAAIEEIERSEGSVMVAFNRRFDPSAIALRQAIRSGQIGEISQVIISSRDPGFPPREYLRRSGGIFRDMTIHDFDMARFLLGEELVEVTAFGSRLIDSSLHELDDFDTVMVLMRTRSGKQCHINCSREAVYGYDQRLEIFGSAGMLLNDHLRASTIRRWTKDRTDAREPLLNFFVERYAEAYRNEFEAFAEAVLGAAPMPVTPLDGRAALHLAECALQSVLTGRSVQV